MTAVFTLKFQLKVTNSHDGQVRFEVSKAITNFLITLTSVILKAQKFRNITFWDTYYFTQTTFVSLLMYYERIPYDVKNFRKNLSLEYNYPANNTTVNFLQKKTGIEYILNRRAII